MWTLPNLSLQSVGTSSIKHGKVVLQLVNQVIELLMQSGTTFKGINQHTQESLASQCDITHAKWYNFCMNESALMTPL